VRFHDRITIRRIVGNTDISTLGRRFCLKTGFWETTTLYRVNLPITPTLRETTQLIGTTCLFGAVGHPPVLPNPYLG
jgi:hypothetical protein